MAKYAQSILTIAGAIIGAYIGQSALGASIGASLGSLLGGALFPNNTTSVGPRLADTAGTASNVGAPIPRGWGTFPAGGCIIVQTDLQEVNEENTVGGKGGPSATTETPTYFQSFAIGINDGLIGGVRVIWANGKPIYDLRPQGHAASSDNSVFLTSPEEQSLGAESDEAYKARIVASQQLATKFTLYLGSESQLPDPTLEAFFGVGNISAFRGLAYIIFHDWQNKAEDGNRMPSQWKFEVYTTADETDDDGSNYSNSILYPWGLSGYPVNDNNVNSFSIFDAGGVQVGSSGSVSSGPYVSLNAVGLAILTGNGRKLGDYVTYTPSVADTIRTDLFGGFSLAQAEFRDVCSVTVHFNNKGFNQTQIITSGIGGDTCVIIGALVLDGKQVYASAYGAGLGAVYNTAGTFGVGFLPGPLAEAGWDTSFSCGGGIDPDLVLTFDQIVTVTRSPSPPLDPCTLADAVPIPGLDGWVVVDGKIEQCGAWAVYTASGGNTCLALQKYVTDSRTIETISTCYVSQYPLNPVLPDGHDDFYNEAFWTDAYSKAVIKGQIAAGKTYVSGGSDDLDKYPQKQASIYKKGTTLTSKTTGSALVSDIFSDICKEAGLQPSDLDVTAIAGKKVIGYIRSNVMAARDAITPLTQAMFFNAIESNAKIACRLLGTDVVRTLKQVELGATVVSDSGGQAVTSLQSQDSQDVDLPRSIRVHYLSQSRDYEAGEQDSPFRVGTAAVNDRDIQLPIVMHDSHALQIAQSIWAQAWAERITYTTTVDAELQELEPVDDIGVPVDGETASVRITGISDALPATRALTMVSTDLESFISTAVASQVPARSRPIPIVTPANAIMLDLPLLRDQDNDSGFYTALLGLLPDSFKSASLYRSTDGGGNFTRLVSTSSAAITGTVSQALPVGPTTVFDEGNILYVELYDDIDTLTSASQADVLGGANAAAIGADGRWEIIQFKSAVHQVGSIYALTGLLRGRRGTEWAVGSSQAGDEFVMLGGTVRTPLDLTLVNKEYQYKSVGAGSTLDDALTELFTGHGVALRPFSPAYFNAVRNATTGAWSFTWLRRGRIGQTLQSGVDVALNETTEDYELKIMAGDTVLRTISSSTEAATYSADQQLTDFAGLQTTVKATVQQISAQVGDGYPNTKTFTS